MLRNLIARLQFWWATKTLKEGKDFDLELVRDSGVIVTLLRGRYKGIVFTFANMTIQEGGLLDFTTGVMYNPNNEDVYGTKFNKIASNILRIILRDIVRGSKRELLYEDREIDTSQSDEERDFHEESSPLLEKRVSKRKPRKKAASRDK